MKVDVNGIEIGLKIVDFVDRFPVQVLDALSGVFRFYPITSRQ